MCFTLFMYLFIFCSFVLPFPPWLLAISPWQIIACLLSFWLDCYLCRFEQELGITAASSIGARAAHCGATRSILYMYVAGASQHHNFYILSLVYRLWLGYCQLHVIVSAAFSGTNVEIWSGRQQDLFSKYGAKRKQAMQTMKNNLNDLKEEVEE